MRVADRRYVASLAGFAACSAGILAALWFFVRWGGWKAAAALAALAAVLLLRFYRGARPDLPPPGNR